MGVDEILGSLPELLRFDGGEPVTDASQWRLRRKEVYDHIIPLEYGGMPPEPECFEMEKLHQGNGLHTYRIFAGCAARRVSFCMQIYVPTESDWQNTPRPVVLTGDGCYRSMNDEVIGEILRRGMLAAKFNRTELAPDIYNQDRNSGLYLVYPESTFGALAAWAWGYRRCMDALERIPYADATRVAITGHSRGGKTALLAGAVDERFAVVNPNNSGAGGAGCYRCHMHLPADTPGVHDFRSETLEDGIRAVPQWYGPALAEYVGREAELPFDQHFLKALVAPRRLLQTEALQDTWANPDGTYQTHQAAQAVYALLGARENIAIHYRPGGHAHGPDDFRTLLDFIENRASVDNGQSVMNR